MLSLALAFALFAQAADATSAEPAQPAPAAEDRLPAGAPREDYQFVAWCYGALRGYLDQHDELMPEVTRIETQFRKPGSNVADDLKVYEGMRKDGQAKLKVFQAALTEAEKASVRPLNAVGAQAVKQGRQIWTAGPEVKKAQRAQEWMSWALPARCERTAGALATRAKLMGATFMMNAEPSAEAAPAPEPAPKPEPARAP